MARPFLARFLRSLDQPRVVAVALHTAVAIGYLAWAIAWTWPLATDLGRQVRDAGDPLLNIFVLEWNVRTWRTGAFGQYFDLPIFHPFDRTLAYSELLFTQGLLATLLRLVVRSPVAVYNLVLLAGLVGSALGAYALAWHHVRHRPGAILAGAVYAFSAFPFAQLSHLQSLWAGGLPLALLLFDRWLVSGRRRTLVALGGVFCLQSLANGHYALYLGVLLGLRLGWELLVAARPLGSQRWRELALAGAGIAILLAPFFYPYLAVRAEQGLVRWLQYAARPASFVSALPGNLLWGDVLSGTLRNSEDALFPGLVATLLAALGWWWARRGSAVERRVAAAQAMRPLVLARGGVWLAAGATAALLLAAAVLARGPLRLSTANGALLLALGVLVGRHRWLRRVGVVKAHSADRESTGFHAALLIFAVLCTFGGSGPYRWLHAWVPGFDGLRVATRFMVPALLALGVLAAFGLRGLASRGHRSRVLALVLVGLAFAEGTFAPVPMVQLPVGREVPEVYRWVARQPLRTVIAELPFGAPNTAETEARRVYSSLYHWRRSVNGYSGFASPLLDRLAREWTTRTPEDLVRELAGVGVGYVLVHERLLPAEVRAEWRAALLAWRAEGRIAERFADTWVLAVGSGGRRRAGDAGGGAAGGEPQGPGSGG